MVLIYWIMIHLVLYLVLYIEKSPLAWILALAHHHHDAVAPLALAWNSHISCCLDMLY